jgi:2-polyprenyl-3-methyl-5-hydroxy-6-metoxy-1,4-benzoquinol methylase
MYTTNDSCRHCGSNDFTLVVDLNDQPPANALVTYETLTQERKYPLRVYVCNECQLMQLRDVVDMDELFQGYVYMTGGAGAAWKGHFTAYAQSLIERFGLTQEARIVEIGSNDGLLLRAFQELGFPHVLGVDPARNVAQLANESGVPTIAAPWNKKEAQHIIDTYGHADVVIGNNVVAHIDNHHELFEGIKMILKPTGFFVFEAPYLVDMFENLTFDTIYHEHLSNLALRPVARMVKTKGLEVFDIELTKSHGISMRTFIGHADAHPVSAHVQECITTELELHMDTKEAYVELGKRITERKHALLDLIASLHKEGKRIAGYGAPAKSSTVINFLGLTPNDIPYLTEELPTKVGKLSPGAHIPLLHVDEARKNPPDYFILFAWNHAEGILKKETELRAKGVKFIIPIGKEIVII